MKKTSIFLVTALIALAGCGDDDDSGASKDPPPKEDAAMATQDEAAETKTAPKGTTITLGDSQFGQMLFDSKKQAIYIFENDSKDKTVCYGECADEWPPVFTNGKPRAGDGVKSALLGTVKRRDGKLQVTYAGQPLYFYAHEEPGVVLCHNVDKNGGLWWVVGPNGKRRP